MRVHNFMNPRQLLVPKPTNGSVDVVVKIDNNAHSEEHVLWRASLKHLKTSILTVLVLAGLIGVPYALWLALRTILDWIGSQESQVSAAIIAATGTVLAGVAAVIFSQQRAKSREIAESQRPHKIEVYNGFIRKMIAFLIKFKDTKGTARKIADDKELQKFFMEFTSQVILWGSPDVIRKYAAFRRAGDAKGSETILAMDDLLRSMRADLGNRGWTLQRGDLVKLLLTDPEKLDESGQITP